MSHLSPHGHLRIYFGYAPGVGKTYQMLQDAQALKSRGGDVVIGFLASHGRQDIAAEAAGLETIAPLLADKRGASAQLNLEAILARRPAVCLVDELAQSNSPGASGPKRWQDVRALLDAGIDVFTTMNVMDLASLSEEVWLITGIRVRETVPDWLFQQADEVVMVDVTQRALLHRLQRGVIYPPDGHPVDGVKSEAADLFDERKLVALRELAMRQTAQAVKAREAGKVDAGPRHEKLLVHITSDPSTATLLRRARRVADFLHGDCLAVFVCPEPDLSRLPAAERQAIERHLHFADHLQIAKEIVHGKDPARALVDHAYRKGVTQIFIRRDSDSGQESRRRWFPRPDFTDRVLLHAHDLQVNIIAQRDRQGRTLSAYPEDEAAGIMHTDYVTVSSDSSVDEAIAEIRRQASQVEMLYYAYALDGEGRLLGVCSFRELLAADRAKRVRDVMLTAPLSVQEDADKEEAAHVLTKQKLLALPVLDAGGRMKGIITSADVAGIVQQEVGEDIQKIGGMEALDGPYLGVTFAHMVRKRAGWLAILFLGEMLTATAMGYYSDEISKAVVLALFIPLIISSGGNSGSQATTLVIRAMALGELRLRDWWRVIRREVAAGAVLGTILGSIGVSRILLWQAIRGTYGPHYALIAATIGCSLIGVVMFGTLAGSMLPFILRRCHLDPASASAPFVATLVDVTGLIIYFTMASIMLRGVLL